MQEEQLPDLSFQNNQFWVLKMGTLLALLLTPSDVAYLGQQSLLHFFLGLLGILAYLIIFHRQVEKLGGDRPLKELVEERETGYPIGLLAASVVWMFFLDIPLNAAIVWLIEAVGVARTVV